MPNSLRYDEIGYWSEIKLDIIKEYASAYSRIMSSQASPQFYHLYIDAFAGAGKHISRSTGEFVPGSPENALLVEPPFREYHFIDLNKLKIESLENMAGTREDVHIHLGNCNQEGKLMAANSAIEWTEAAWNPHGLSTSNSSVKIKTYPFFSSNGAAGALME